ncbi:MAG: AMP-binding protein [Candidatus Sumerlaeia bacterium]|nr:AMP-binding protein [Candidatus Sumerlaeia bacterium]
MDLKRALYESWKTYGSNPAVIDDTQRLTLDETLRRAVALSRLIALSDSSETGHVGIVLPNSEWFVAAFLGCLAADRAAVPINCLLSPPEVAFILDHAQVRLVLTASPFRPLMDAAQQSGAGGIQAVYLDEMLAAFGPQQIAAALAAADPTVLDSGQSDPNRTACLIYTSGTTGVAKGVMLSHRNLVANCRSMQQVLEIRPSDVFLSVLPLFHSFGLSTAMLLPLLTGSSMVLMRRFHPTTAIELIEREKVTCLLMVASMFALLMRTGSREPSRLQSVRIAISGGGPLPPSLGEEFQRRIGFPIFQGYGLTEASPVVATNHPGACKPLSVGQPIPGVRAQIRDDAGQVLPPEATGDIYVAGDNVMEGYYRNPEATAQTIDADGWLKTGDTGYLDSDGFLYVTGRKKDMIILGGEKIFPQEIEHILTTHPAIAEAAVVGISDPLRGEMPKAFLVLNEGATVDERELRVWCAERMAAYKIPREFEVIPELPKNTLGKVLKRELLKREG